MTEAPPELSASQKSAPELENASVVKPWTEYLGTQGRFRISDEGREIDENPRTYASTKYVFPKGMKPDGVVPKTLAYFFN